MKDAKQNNGELPQDDRRREYRKPIIEIIHVELDEVMDTGCKVTGVCNGIISPASAPGS